MIQVDMHEAVTHIAISRIMVNNDGNLFLKSSSLSTSTEVEQIDLGDSSVLFKQHGV